MTDNSSSGLQKGGFTTDVSASGYQSQGFSVDLTADMTRNFTLGVTRSIVTRS